MTADPACAGTLLSLPPPTVSAERLGALAWEHWGLGGDLVPLTSERDLNHRLDTGAGRFTLKLANAAEPRAMTEFQTAALLHVAKRDPGLPIPRVFPARDQRFIIPTEAGALRLLSWCPGVPVAHAPRSVALAQATGTALARLTRVLADFSHPAADHVLLWDIGQFARLAPLATALTPDILATFQDFDRRFHKMIAPRLAQLPTQVVHADFNPHNLLSDPESPAEITGILDFGDMVRTARICDLAVAASYLVVAEDPLALILPLVGGYHAQLPLLAEELSLLPDLIMARMLTTLVISAWRAARYPENAAYILRNAPSARAGLAAFGASDRRALVRTLVTACERSRP